MANRSIATGDGKRKDGKEREAALEKALSAITKEFGQGAIMKMGDKADTKIDVNSTGILSLDYALGVGGFPKGRIIEIYGPESSGKTTIALHATAEVQKNGGTVAYIDAENAMDPAYATALGVDIDGLLLSQPDTGEQGLEIADALVSSGAVDLVVIDSVAALVPRAEIEGEMGDAHVGLQARMMSQALRKLAGSINKTRTTVIFINKLREKVGVMFGSPETTPGGRALKFYATIRLDVRRRGQIKDGTDVIGNETTIKVVKNKVAPPFKIAELNMMYGSGISATADILDLAVENGIAEKAGSWFSYHGERLGQGKPNVVNILEQKPEILHEMDQEVRAKIFAPEEEPAKKVKEEVTAPKKTTKKAKKADDDAPVLDSKIETLDLPEA